MNATEDGQIQLYRLPHLLSPPPDLLSVIRSHPDLDCYPPDVLRTRLAHANHTSLFLPSTQTLRRLLHPIAFEFLTRPDLAHLAQPIWASLFDYHLVSHHPEVLWTSILATVSDVPFQAGPQRPSAQLSRLITNPNILASNGVVHIIDDALHPPTITDLNPAMIFAHLNITIFLKQLHHAQLTKQYLNPASHHPYTLLAPSDDILHQLKATSAEDIGLLKYHVAPGHWFLSNLSDGFLLQTEYEPSSLFGQPQRLKLTHRPSKAGHIQEHFSTNFTFPPSGDGIRSYINGIQISEGPFLINNTLIYQISSPLSKPKSHQDLLQDDPQFSIFNRALSSGNGKNKLQKSNNTLLVPPDHSWLSLGLAHDWLFSSSEEAALDLDVTLSTQILPGLLYSEDLQSLPSPSSLSPKDPKAGSLQLTHGSGRLFINDHAVIENDVLASNGVVHVLDSVLLPVDLKIDNRKLLLAANCSIMYELLSTSDFSGSLSVSNSTASSWTIIAPSDAAWSTLNVSQLRADRNALNAILRQHIIPSPGLFVDSLARRLSLGSLLGQEIRTLHSSSEGGTSVLGGVVIRQSDNSSYPYSIHVKGSWYSSSTSSAQIRSWGKQTIGKGRNRGGVLLVDSVIMPFQHSWSLMYTTYFALATILGSFAILGIKASSIIEAWRRPQEEDEPLLEPEA